MEKKVGLLKHQTQIEPSESSEKLSPQSSSHSFKDSFEESVSSTPRFTITLQDPSHTEALQLLPQFEKNHPDIKNLLAELLEKNSEIRSSPRGLLALYKAADQDPEFKSSIVQFLKNPIIGIPAGGEEEPRGFAVVGSHPDTTQKPATGSWALHEKMEALPESIQFNRSELGFLIGSIARDRTPIEKDLFKDI